MPLDPNQIAFAKDLLTTLRSCHSSAAATPKKAAHQRSMALTIIHLIEARAPESELWTSSPDAADVTADSRLGDHLYLTRKHFNLPA